tara:strand:- start:11 stop:394 length:384 start_codon:yes stop_codon:yes gene_type:complete
MTILKVLNTNNNYFIIAIIYYILLISKIYEKQYIFVILNILIIALGYLFINKKIYIVVYLLFLLDILYKYLKNKKIEKFDTDKGGLDHETAEKNNSETHKKDHVSVRGVSPTLVTEIAEEEVDSDDE